jgi:CYTH domain-containing protein
LLRQNGTCGSVKVALEIERRFLVTGGGWRRHSLGERCLRQGYLVSGSDGLTLRIRISEPGGGKGEGAGEPAQAWLTLKAPPPFGPSASPAPAKGHSSAAAAAPPVSTAPPTALSRLEFEYAIPLADGEDLLALSSARVLKRRHGLDLPGGDWVLDVFLADNAPLVVAEVELSSANQVVEVPPWCGRELTGRHDLSNAALALRPLVQWGEAERRELFG